MRLSAWVWGMVFVLLAAAIAAPAVAQQIPPELMEKLRERGQSGLDSQDPAQALEESRLKRTGDDPYQTDLLNQLLDQERAALSTLEVIYNARLGFFEEEARRRRREREYQLEDLDRRERLLEQQMQRQQMLSQQQALSQSGSDRSRLSATPGAGTLTGSPERLRPQKRNREREQQLETEQVLAEFAEPEPLRQYGYDMLDYPKQFPGGLSGRLPDTYRLGIGDELVVTLYGNENSTLTLQVDREGRLVLPDLGPVSAAGRELGVVRSEVVQLVSEKLVGTEVLLSVGAPRLVSTYVLGDVTRPGQYELSSFADILDALSVAGGVKKTGSLRRIIVDDGTRRRSFDLYDILAGRQTDSLRLTDGMRIIVPPIGPTVAVAGAVVRPAIYELAPGTATPAAERMLAMAGGSVLARGSRMLVKRVSPEGGETVRYLSGAEARLQPSDILLLQLRSQATMGQFELAGAVYSPGIRSIDEYGFLSKALEGGQALKPDAYLPFALLKRKDPETLATVMRAVNLAAVLKGETDVRLRSWDELVVLNETAVDFMGSEPVKLTIDQPNDPGNCESLEMLAKRVREAETERFATTFRSAFFTSQEMAEQDSGAAALSGQMDRSIISDRQTGEIACPDLFEDRPDLLAFALEYATAISGAVRQPGIYPFAYETSLAGTIAVAGGLSLNANRKLVELSLYERKAGQGIDVDRRKVDLTETDPKSVAVSPGSSVRVTALRSDQEPGTVLLTGEFERPGVYTIKRGETLLELIGRAGGLTSRAYPYGAVFTRESVRDQRRESLKRTAREMDTALTLAAIKGNVDGEALTAARRLSNTLSSADITGRMVVDAEPEVLARDPIANISLEPGDTLHMPRRPTTVQVAGDVLNPGSFRFREGKSVRDYLKEAGGLQSTAEKGRIFVVKANGEATPVSMSVWSFREQTIPPGTTIVVPMDVTPIQYLEIAGTIADIFGNLALSVASVASVTN
ncbi:SLBB domain-containing protein [Rhodothalassium salexigens]|uniref:SLBB domain-containing protein n=1 Tax=Rhodothalassium salexigens TaxID=1086 RepID=UPI0019147AE6|nr:SLBB domain-containing protein [Rhodothalassium salexigens]